MMAQEQTAGQQGKDDLLDTVAKKLGYSYLSDLKMPQHKAAIAELLTTIDAGQYVLSQWNEALAYLCNAQPCQDALSAKEALIKSCQSL